jgi:hypothetical protein
MPACRLMYRVVSSHLPSSVHLYPIFFMTSSVQMGEIGELVPLDLRTVGMSKDILATNCVLETCRFGYGCHCISY